MDTTENLLDGYLSVANAAKALGVHVRTLKAWKARNYGPRPVYVGKRMYYRRAELVSWLESLGMEKPKRGRR